MNVAVIREPHQPLIVEKRPLPTPQAGELLVKIGACGICHGDLMVHQGAFPFVKYPIVPGHEIAGTVEEVGPDVANWKPGDRVGISVLFSSCGACTQCLKGSENLCPSWTWTGMMVDGGYAEYFVAKAAYASRLPQQLSDAEAAPLMCAGLTVYSGLLHSGLKPGERVAVIALGGLGHLAVQYAIAMGARVAVVSTHGTKEEEARRLGAEQFFCVDYTNLSQALRDWEGGPNVIIATAPNVESVTAALPGLAVDGTLVVLGVGPGRIEIDPTELIMGRRRIIGSPAGSRNELTETLRLAAKHAIRPKVTAFPLEKVNDAFAAIQGGHVAGRVVLVNEQ